MALQLPVNKVCYIQGCLTGSLSCNECSLRLGRGHLERDKQTLSIACDSTLLNHQKHKLKLIKAPYGDIS